VTDADARRPAAAAGAAVPASARAPRETLLAVEGVSLRFGGVRALSNVGFGVERGEIRAIIGPNGAGKSSMLNVVNGFYRPQQGRIIFKGRVVDRRRPHAAAADGIARTFQNIALFKNMSTLDNVMTGRLLKMRSTWLEQMVYAGRARREEIAERRRCEEIIDFLELQGVRHTPVGKLAYGLQKRVELARALALEPVLLLLDEPMAGMNVEEKEDMCRFVIEANEAFDTTVLLIEHDMSVVMDICDRVVVLDHGELLADGAPAAVKSDPAVVAAYLGVAAG
jgi:branched-chain amino acid transport system ATP-binding protein